MACDFFAQEFCRTCARTADINSKPTNSRQLRGAFPKTPLLALLPQQFHDRRHAKPFVGNRWVSRSLPVSANPQRAAYPHSLRSAGNRVFSANRLSFPTV